MIQKFFVSLLIFAPFRALALTSQDSGLDDAAEGTGLAQFTIVELIGLVIKGALSLVGVIFLLLIVIGGFKWMTSGGNADKVKQARQTIFNAVIGVIIVVAAYAITYFIFDVLLGSGGGGGADSEG